MCRQNKPRVSSFSVHFTSIIDKSSSSVSTRCEKLKQYSENEIKYIRQKKKKKKKEL